MPARVNHRGHHDVYHSHNLHRDQDDDDNNKDNLVHVYYYDNIVLWQI